MDGRTDCGGLLPPPRTPPNASAFGDTNGEIFGRTIFRPESFSIEHFAVRIAEGGSIGGSPGGPGAPPGPSVHPFERFGRSQLFRDVVMVAPLNL